MNPGRSAETMTCLPSRSPSARIAASVASSVSRAADQLDERHDRHRAEEVHPDEPLAALAARRPRQGGGSRSRSCSRRRSRPARRQRVEVAPEGRLDGEVLEDRLDDEIGVGDAREVSGRCDPCERRVAVVLARDGPWPPPDPGWPRSCRAPPRRGAGRARRATTGSPIAAWTWAIPWPISPAPATKTRSIELAMPTMVRWSGRSAPGARGSAARRSAGPLVAA